MTDLFEDLDKFTKKLDEGKEPQNEAKPQKKTGSANKQKEFTYDLDDNELNQMISGQQATEMKKAPAQTQPALQDLAQFQPPAQSPEPRNMGFSSKFGLKNVEICDVDNGQMKVIEDDGYLDPFNQDLKLRHREFQK